MDRVKAAGTGGYFVRIASLPSRLRSPAVGESVLLAGGTGTATRKVLAILIIIGSIVGGFAVAGAFLLLSAIFSMWGSSTDGNTAFAVMMGFVVGASGIAWGILSYLPWTRPSALSVTPDVMRLSYIGFGKPLLVDRALVRVVSVDDAPSRLFQNNSRFPVRGQLPPDAYIDALDRYPVSTWDPPGDHPAFPIPSSVSDREEQGYLFSRNGVALPLARLNPEDVPNVAVLFTVPVKTPRRPLGVLPVYALRGGRTVKGLMVRVTDPDAVRRLFEPWKVVREVTADDVIAEGLRVAKPLRGWRTWVYAAILLMPFVLRLVSRMAHHR